MDSLEPSNLNALDLFQKNFWMKTLIQRMKTKIIFYFLIIRNFAKENMYQSNGYMFRRDIESMKPYKEI